MGEVLGGRYELVDPLAEGGSGSVWRCWDHRDGTYRAAKVLRQADGDSLLRFVRETSHRVQHPHVVAPSGWTGEDDRVLFTMPLVRGGSVATLLADFGALPLGWVVELLRQSLAALVQVHGAGLVHRDVTPANLLLEATGTGRPHLRLSDFGIATRAGSPRLTRTDAVMGTPGYLAPEQLGGAEPAPAQDLYALGVVATQMLSGTSPTSSGRSAPGPRTGDTGAAVADLVDQLVAVEPAARPPSAAAALATLDGLPGTHDLGLGADPAQPVEVFDQVPELPEGWGEHGPTYAGPAPPGRDRASTPTAVRAAVRRVPVLAWWLGLVGVLLLLAAVLVAVS